MTAIELGVGSVYCFVDGSVRSHVALGENHGIVKGGAGHWVSSGA